MRKRVKTITEETHEYGTIVLETPLYSELQRTKSDFIDCLLTMSIKYRMLEHD
jgi:hypothetical protein